MKIQFASTQPMKKWKYPGPSVTLTVSVTGSRDLKYQWIKANGDKLKLPHCRGDDTNKLCITAFSHEHIGEYKCKVSNEFGHQTSDVVKLKGINKYNVMDVIENEVAISMMFSIYLQSFC